MPQQLKVSEIPGYLDQIEIGSNKYLSHDIEDHLQIFDPIDMGIQGTFNVKVKIDTPTTSKYNLRICHNDVEFISCSKEENVDLFYGNNTADIKFESDTIDETIQFTVKGININCFIFVVLYQNESFGKPTMFSKSDFVEVLTIPVTGVYQY